MAPTIISSVTVPAVAPFAGGQPLDLIDLASVKLEFQITDGSNDQWLQSVITRASRAIGKYCNRVFAPQSWQEQFWALRDPYPWQLPSGFFPLQLSAWPLSSPPSPAGTAPPQAPVLSAVGGGSLDAATYYVRITYVTAAGETACSIEQRLAVAASSLLSVAAPGADPLGLATGWNVYVGTKSFGEQRQNSAPIGINNSFTLSTTGLLAAAPNPPNYITVVENWPLAPTPLAEGVDFLSDYDPGPDSKSKGWLTRLFPMDESPRRWSSLPILVQYQAGYPEIPDDLQDAALQLVKDRWFARTRDPKLRQENVAGVYEASWWFDGGPGSSGPFAPSIEALIDPYRVSVIA